MTNPFYIETGQDFGRQLSGIGSILEENREARRKQSGIEAMKAAWASQDPNAISQVAIDFPELGDRVGQMAQFNRMLSDNNLRSMAMGAYEARNLPDNESRLKYLDRRIEEIQTRGGDASDSIELRDDILAGLSIAKQDERLNNVIRLAEAFGAVQPQADQSQKQLESELKQEKNQFDMTVKLQDKVAGASKEFNKVRDAKNRVDAVFDTNQQAINEFNEAIVKQDPNASDSVQDNVFAFGDMALIFNFMKMLDPGSTVREGEFANAQNTAGIPDRILNLRNQLLNGQRLTPSQREGIRRQSEGLFKTSKNQNEKDLKKFKGTAKKFGLDENLIFQNDDELTAAELEELRALEAEFGN